MTDFLPDEVNHHEIKELTPEQEQQYSDVLMVLYLLLL